MKHSYYRFILIIVLICLPSIGTARSLYKCGNSYRDTPCNNQAKQQKLKNIKLNNNQSNKDSHSALPVNVECAARGKSAQKIMWKREVGFTLEKQLKAAENKQHANLIRDVYELNGSSLHVKSAIEQSCAEQHERNRKAIELEREASRLRAGSNASADTADRPYNQTPTQIPSKNKESNASKQSSEKQKAACRNLEIQLQSTQASRRTGGNSSTMEALKKKRKELQSKFKSNNC